MLGNNRNHDYDNKRNHVKMCDDQIAYPACALPVLMISLAKDYSFTQAYTRYRNASEI